MSRDGKRAGDNPQMLFITLLGSPCSKLPRKTVLWGPNFPCVVSAGAELVWEFEQNHFGHLRVMHAGIEIALFPLSK